MVSDGFLLESEWHPAMGDAPALYRLILTNRTPDALTGFRLGFSGPTRIGSEAEIAGGQIHAQLSNYCEIAPGPGFVLTPGERWTIDIGRLEYPIRHWTDGATTGFVILANDTAVAAVTLPTRHAGSSEIRRRGTMAQTTPADATVPISVIPWPKTVDVAGRRTAPQGLDIQGREPVIAVFKRLTEMLFPGEAIVRPASADGFPVRLKLAAGPTSEGYRISFFADDVLVEAATQTGLLYGLVTLGQIQRGARLHLSTFSFPTSGFIEDAPQMAWRGCHLDVARRFYSVDEVAQFLAVMAWNKLNVFHWHLSDDEGFRVEIDAFPELIEKAAWRGHGLPIPPLLGSGPERSGGYYRKAEVQKLVAFASDLGIDVVPEIDVPGHCFALIEALPQLRDPGENGLYHSIQSFPNNCLNPGVEAVYPALETIFAELIALFPSRYFHVGADEVPSDAWSASPMAQALGLRGAAPLQAHFLKRIQAFLTANGKIAGAWEEAAQGGGIDKANCYLVGWHSVEASQKLAAAGYPVVVAPGQTYYLDMANAEDWHEPGAGWAGWSSPEKTYGFDPSEGWSAEERSRLMGVQACIWSEPMTDRGVFDRLVFPRLSAIAESGWTAPEDKSFSRFAALVALMPNLYGVFETNG